MREVEPLSPPVVEVRGDRDDPAPARAVERPMLAQVDRSAGGRKDQLELDVSGGYHDFIAQHTYEAATEPNVGIRCAW